MSITRFLLTVIFVTVLGCTQSSDNATVQGTVTIDGVLATRGTVTFHPVEKGPVAIGQIHKDGSYALRTGAGNTVDPDAAKIPAGEYVVTVMVMGDSPDAKPKDDGSPPIAGPRLTAIKYASKETSGLTFTIKPGRNVFALELDGAASDPPPESETEDSEIDAEDEIDEPIGDQAPAEVESQSANQPTGEALQPTDKRVTEESP
jgi:hypothetical protein